MEAIGRGLSRFGKCLMSACVNLFCAYVPRQDTVATEWLRAHSPTHSYPCPITSNALEELGGFAAEAQRAQEAAASSRRASMKSKSGFRPWAMEDGGRGGHKAKLSDAQLPGGSPVAGAKHRLSDA